MKGNDFILDYDHLLHFKCHKINPNCGGPYIVSLGWIKYKKATINTINKGDYKRAKTTRLNYGDIGKPPERLSKIKHFIDKYNRRDSTHLKKVAGYDLRKIPPTFQSTI